MITDDDIYRFTNGACWILGEVLEERAGLPRRYVKDQHGKGMHVVAQLPDGRYLDVEGAHEQDDLLRHYQHPRFARYAQAVGDPDGDWTLPYYWGLSEDELRERAEEIAPDVLALAA